MNQFRNTSLQRRVGSARRRQGQTILEFALVLPVLMLLIFTIFEFAFYERDQIRLVNATREGARMASLGAPQNQVKQRVENLALPLQVTDSEITLDSAPYSNGVVGTYGVWPADIAGATPTNGVNPGDVARVSVTVPRTQIVPVPFLRTTQIRASTAMMRTQ